MATTRTPAAPAGARAGGERPAPKSLELSLVEHVIEQIREDIVHARLAPGQRLIEADLAERHQVSRGTLREALRILATEGILAAEHNRGFRVRRFSAEDLTKMMRAHEALAALNSRMAAERVAAAVPAQRKALVAALAASVKSMRAKYDAGDNEAFLLQYPVFHGAIAELGANEHVIALQAHLPMYVFRHYFRRVIDQDVVDRWMRDHDRLLEVISAGDGDAAERALREHVRRFRERTEAMAATLQRGSLPWD